MQISKNNARHLARYLSKGILEHPGTREISISIGEDATIGIVRRGRKYVLCIKYKDAIQKEDMRSGFNENISEEDLANLVIDVIENSSVLLEVALNMDKVPMLQDTTPMLDEPENENKTEDFFEETPPADIPSTNMMSESVEDEDVSDEPTGIAIMAEEKHEPSFTTDDSEDLEDTAVNFESLNTEATEAENNTSAIITEEIEAEIKSVEMNENPDSAQPDEKTDEDLQDEKDDNEKEDIITMTMSEKKVETAIQAQGLLPSPTETKAFADASYISSLLGDSEDIQNKFSAIFREIANRDRELAVEYYVRGLYNLMPLLDNDIDSVAAATGIDKRDIVLAIYERQQFA